MACDVVARVPEPRVVYGDMATSLLYVYKSAFVGNDIQHPAGNEEIYGVLSFVFWMLTLITLLKYVLIVLHADDGGEGGTFALYSLICHHVHTSLLPGGGTRDELMEEEKATGRRGEQPVLRVRAVLEKYRVLQRLLLLFANVCRRRPYGENTQGGCSTIILGVRPNVCRRRPYGENTQGGCSTFIED